MNEAESTEFERSHCPVANVLDLFGDKWTLLIVRDLILGKARYGEFAQSKEGIPTNILVFQIVESLRYNFRGLDLHLSFF